MMKFPKPRVLEENPYPDHNATQPELLHNLVHNFINPADNSPMDSYLKNSIQYLKDLQRTKGTVKINNYSVGSNLYFTNVTINQDSDNKCSKCKKGFHLEYECNQKPRSRSNSYTRKHLNSGKPQ